MYNYNSPPSNYHHVVDRCPTCASPCDLDLDLDKDDTCKNCRMHKLESTTIHFTYDGDQLVTFEMIQNLEAFGHDIMNAFICWCARLEGEPKVEDFIEYVRSKNTGATIYKLNV